MSTTKNYDVIIIGAGAAGLMCAIESAKRNRKTLIIDHSNKVGKKILMSGGGRCNFTNYNIAPDKYLSNNIHFMKSSLKRYTQWDFIGLVSDYEIAFHEKTLGQLFCNNKAKDIVNMLLSECKKYSAEIKLNTKVTKLFKNDEKFNIHTETHNYQCESLVIATGGLSIPTMGATGFGYKIAKQFNIKTFPHKAGLVPFILNEKQQQKFSKLKGISINCVVSNEKASFEENILFTHKGLSGPAILQISSFWQENEAIEINLSPKQNVSEFLAIQRNSNPRTSLRNTLSQLYAKNFVNVFFTEELLNKTLANLTNQEISNISNKLHCWKVYPKSTEGYKTAEVTLGGIDCNELSSKTMESLKVKGLYFIGEVVDVTGWLGGYNFQWAWASGWASGQVV